MEFHLARRFTLLGLCVTAAGIPLYSQSTEPLQFEVASVKPTVDMTLPGRINRTPNQYLGTNMPLLSYITVAYQVKASSVTGPDWITTDHFDLVSKADRACTPDELHLMLQHLLEERFHLKLRREMKDQAGYNLVVEKGGPKLNNHSPEDHATAPLIPGPGKHIGTNVTMTYLAFYLSNELDRTVVDKTGLDGHYDFEVEWGFDRVNTMPMPSGPQGAPDTAVMARPMEMGEAQMPTGPTIFVALQKQLGLRLDPAKVPVERLVVDHVEKLTDN